MINVKKTFFFSRHRDFAPLSDYEKSSNGYDSVFEGGYGDDVRVRERCALEE